MTETIFMEILKISPYLAIALLVGFFIYKEVAKRIDNNRAREEKRIEEYQALVKEIRKESSEREERILEDGKKRENKLMNWVDNLTGKLSVIDSIKEDIQEIKNKLEK